MTTEVMCPQPTTDVIHNRLLIHQSTNSLNRNEVFDGKEYLVSPVIALVEGVVNGEYVSGVEIGKYIKSWNGIPLPIGHPTSHGIPISANCPTILERNCIGHFFNATCDGHKLKGELWIDITKAKQMGGDALNVLSRLEQGLPLEVSTAYYRDYQPTRGTSNGKAYDGEQTNLRPDHLALLLHEIGACSWEDGCGGPRVNVNEIGKKTNREIKEDLVINRIKRGMKMDKTKKKSKVADIKVNTDEIGHEQIAEMLEQAMSELYEGDNMAFYIKERYDTFIIYQESDGLEDYGGTYFKRDYTVGEGSKVTLGEPVEVTMVTEYVPVSSGEPVDGEDEEVPAENKKKGITMVVQEMKKKVKEDIKENVAEEVIEEEPKSFEAWVDEIPDEDIREEMKANQKKMQLYRQGLIKDLNTNAKCLFDEEELRTMKTQYLEKLDKSIKSDDYSAKGGPRTNTSDNDDDSSPMPEPVLLKKNTEKK